MPEPIAGTPKPSPQEILAGIQAALKSEDAQARLDAIQTLGEQSFSSPAILRILEELSLQDQSKAVRESARKALETPTHRYIYSHTTDLKRRERQIVLEELNEWENRGFIGPEQAEIIRLRYGFDLIPTNPVPISEEHPTKVEPIPAKEMTGKPPDTTPRPGLTQTLLSETSIKIALYLGAFFVIAAAAILAAVVEAARLPILLAATVLFAGGAMLTRGRLPQPSFALFVVFSFLLPTNANVLADVLNITNKASAGYWFAVMAAMALIWGFGTWYYESRLFSLATFAALAIAVVRLGEFLEAELEIHLVLLSVVNLLCLGSAYILKRWRSTKFSLPLFILVQIFQLGLVAFALVAIVSRTEPGSSTWNLVSTSFWLLGMLFYVLSDLAFPFVLFPWLAAAALYPLPLNLMLAFDVEALPIAAATWVWGILLALTGEAIRRLPTGKANRYELPALAGSLFVILTAIIIGFLEDISYGFTFLLISAVLYAVLHVLKPRVYLWTTALLLGLGAYFSFFHLPFMEGIDVFAGYQLLGASLLLLVPDLFLSPDFSADKIWRLPLRAFGGTLAFFNMVGVLPIPTGHAGQAAIAYGIYAVFFTLFALKFNRPWLGYLTTAAASLAATLTLQHFTSGAWLLTLTALAASYYLAGFAVGMRESHKAWSGMLRYSGLGLASIVSIVAIVTLEENSGWYLLIAALLFAIEMFSQRASLAEAGLQLFLASGLFLLLHQADLERGYLGSGLAIALLGIDLLLHLTYEEKRSLALISRSVGAMVVALNTLDLFLGNSSPHVAAACFGVYSLFFLAQTWLYRQPVLGYSASLFTVLTLIFTLQAWDQPNWMLSVAGLAAVYYATGYFLRKRPPERTSTDAGTPVEGIIFTWPFVLWTSGLGAGLLATLAAPTQGGLSAAIPPAVTATMVAVEAFDRRNVWLGFPANALYLMSYFIILVELNVDEPQFYSIAAAALGMMMHYLLTRAGSQTGAFLTGMVSQLVLLSTTYIQFLSTDNLAERLLFFAVIFFQALVVLAYGIVIRSRSLVITPIVFAVLSVITALYGLLEGIWPVILIGCTGLLLLLLGILAVILRERFKLIGERFAEWGA